MPKQHWKPVQIAHGAHYVDITASRNDYLHGKPANQDWRVLWAVRETIRERAWGYGADYALGHITDFAVVQDTPAGAEYVVPCLRVYVNAPAERIKVEADAVQGASRLLGQGVEVSIRMYPEATPRTPETDEEGS